MPNQGVRQRLRLFALWAVGSAVILALVASAMVIWSVRRSYPEHAGTLTIRGLSAPVTMYRDEYGVPQLYAASEKDAFLAEGYVHAQDRFWEMDFRRHLTAGRLSELFGESLVPTDAFLRTLGWRRIAEEEWQVISPPTRARLQDYADGVNAWIADHGGAEATGTKSLEYTVLSIDNPGYTIEPWDPVDSLAWLKAMAWEMRSNMDAETNRAALLAAGLSRAQIDDLYPPFPYARNRPIIANGTVAGDTFQATPASPVAAPAALIGPVPPVGGWRAAAPVLEALGSAVHTLPGLLGVEGTGVGSNSWVVSGSLTTTGKPILANDPHLSPSMPGVWYQIGLHCTCSFNVVGFSLSGVPGVFIGHNNRIAWGLTGLGADVIDLYLERVEGDRYFDGTAWRDVERRQEIIKVAGGPPVPVTVRSTKHGPLLSDRSEELLAVAAQPPPDLAGPSRPPNEPTAAPSLDAGAPNVPPQAAATPYAVALRWTALEPGRTIEALFGLDTAQNWSDFRSAAARLDVPAQNLVYADVDGNIGYQAPGRIPVRKKGDGAWPAPGWDPAYDWAGYIPFGELPNLYNPPDGVIVTANQAAVGPQYPYQITSDWSYGYRSQRLLDMIAERTRHGKLGLDDMRQMQFDNRNTFAAELVPALLIAPLGADTTVAKARDLLRDWDFQQPAETPARTSAAAAFYNATWRHLLLRTFDELPPDRKPAGDDRYWEVLRPLLAQPTSPWWDDRSTRPTETMNDVLVAAMKDAVAELRTRLGDDPSRWRWGDLHTVTLSSNSFGQSGIAPIERLFNRGPVRLSGGPGIVDATSWSAADGYEATIVPSMRMIVDMSNLDGSRWVNLTGNSGHAFNANYADQVELWRTGANLPMRWQRSSVEAAANATLTLVPAGAR